MAQPNTPPSQGFPAVSAGRLDGSGADPPRGRGRLRWRHGTLAVLMADDTTAPACPEGPGEIASAVRGAARRALRMLLAAPLLAAVACGPPSPRAPVEIAAPSVPLAASPLDVWL